MQEQEEIKCRHEKVVLDMSLKFSPEKWAYCLHCKIEVEILKPSHLIHNFKVKGTVNHPGVKCSALECINCDEKKEKAGTFQSFCQKCEKRYLRKKLNDWICEDCKYETKNKKSESFYYDFNCLKCNSIFKSNNPASDLICPTCEKEEIEKQDDYIKKHFEPDIEAI